MKGQLALDVNEPHQLTERQTYALETVKRAGHDGIEPAELGAALHALKEGRNRHEAGERCEWCGGDGLAMLRRLRELGHVAYQGKRKVWIATGATPAGMLTDDQPLPY